MRYGQILGICFALLPLLIGPSEVLAEDVSFNRDIRPLLSKRCFACHGPDAESRESGLRLDQADGDEGAYGSAIEPGSVEDSEMWKQSNQWSQAMSDDVCQNRICEKEICSMRALKPNTFVVLLFVLACSLQTCMAQQKIDPLSGKPVTPLPDSTTLIAQGFTSVFNGKDLTDWVGGDEWSVEDGALTGVADGTLKANRFIVWQGEPLKNFELQVMVRVSGKGNSGIQYRGKVRPDLGPFRVSGYQCDIVASAPAYDGMLYEEMGRRILARQGKKVIIDTNGQPWITGATPVIKFEPDQWHRYRVLAEGNHLRHWVDGHPTVDVVDLDEKGRALEGVLAVQVHKGPPMKIQFKDFLLKRLPDGLPMVSEEEVTIPADAVQVKPQGRLPKDWRPVTYGDR